MKSYKVDISISQTVGKTVRETVYTFPKANEKEAMQFAIGHMKLSNNMLGEDVNYFIHKIEVVA